MTPTLTPARARTASAQGRTSQGVIQHGEYAPYQLLQRLSELCGPLGMWRVKILCLPRPDRLASEPSQTKRNSFRPKCMR